MSREDVSLSKAMDDKFLTHFRFVEELDAEFICNLRSDPSLNKHISSSSPDVVVQKEWIRKYKERERDGLEYYFVIDHNTRPLGVVRMYDFKSEPKSFSWGSWIILPSRPSGFVTYSAVMIYEIGFDILGFEQSHFNVRKENMKVIDFHLRSGAIQTHETEVDVHFVFPREKWNDFKAISDKQIRAHRFFAG